MKSPLLYKLLIHLKHLRCGLAALFLVSFAASLSLTDVTVFFGTLCFAGALIYTVFDIIMRSCGYERFLDMLGIPCRERAFFEVASPLAFSSGFFVVSFILAAVSAISRSMDFSAGKVLLIAGFFAWSIIAVNCSRLISSRLNSVLSAVFSLALEAFLYGAYFYLSFFFFEDTGVVLFVIFSVIFAVFFSFFTLSFLYKSYLKKQS